MRKGTTILCVALLAVGVVAIVGCAEKEAMPVGLIVEYLAKYPEDAVGFRTEREMSPEEVTWAESKVKNPFEKVRFALMGDGSCGFVWYKLGEGEYGKEDQVHLIQGTYKITDSTLTLNMTEKMVGFTTVDISEYRDEAVPCDELGTFTWKFQDNGDLLDENGTEWELLDRESIKGSME